MTCAPLSKWLETAATFSLPGPGVSRFFLTKDHRMLIDYLSEQMRLSGLEVELDAAGNLIGHKASRQSDKVLYLGSHQDTVPGGGRYDGMLGILTALAALYELKDWELPYNVELIAFGDEEGTRFQTTLIGSRAVAGTFDLDVLDLKDDQGVTLRQALLAFSLNPERIPGIARSGDKALGYVEIHIEQGPVLEYNNLPLGLVNAITGIERHLIRIRGKAGHAGTVPMGLRKDALVAATEYVRWLDSYCRENENVIGVVGKLNVFPNSVNVIPEHVELTVELRSPEVERRLAARNALAIISHELMKKGFHIESELIYSQEAIVCDKRLTSQLEEALKRQQVQYVRLFSGAGHDGLAMQKLCPVTMLFVRCKDGLSHHPDEEIDIQDANIAKSVLKDFLVNLTPPV